MKKIKNNIEIVFEKDSLTRLKEINDKNILIMTDSFLSKSPLINEVLKNINSTNKLKIYDKVIPDPSLEIVSDALKIFVKEEIDLIIGFGGGSSIDAAKAVIYFAGEFIKRKIFFVAIPTTSGTGSEHTSVAVITDNETKIKHLLQSEDMLPNLAILDVNLVKDLPQTIIANTGIDVLTHAIEAYIGKNRSFYSDALSEKAGEIVVKKLYRSYINKEDLEAKEDMHFASMIAGAAFEIAGLGINHAIAHQIGGCFHIPHGLCNGILLESVIDFNSKDVYLKNRYANYARKIGFVNSSDDDIAVGILKNFIKILQKIMKMPSSLKECGVNREDFDKFKKMIAKNAMKDNCMKFAPKSISTEEVEKILEEIY